MSNNPESLNNQNIIDIQENTLVSESSAQAQEKTHYKLNPLAEALPYLDPPIEMQEEYSEDTVYISESPKQVPITKKNFATVFWIIWCFAALSDCLILLVGAQHYISLSISAIVLAAAFMLRKLISINNVRLVISWLVILLLLATIIDFAASGENGVLGLSHYKAVSSQFTNGDVLFTKEGFARTVDPKTNEPIAKTVVFSSKDKVINYILHFDYIPSGIQLYAKWSPAESGKSLDYTQKIERELNDYNYNFYLNVQPGKRIPSGDYTLEITGTKDSMVLFKVNDHFKVVN